MTNCAIYSRNRYGYSANRNNDFTTEKEVMYKTGNFLCFFPYRNPAFTPQNCFKEPEKCYKVIVLQNQMTGEDIVIGIFK